MSTGKNVEIRTSKGKNVERQKRRKGKNVERGEKLLKWKNVKREKRRKREEVVEVNLNLIEKLKYRRVKISKKTWRNIEIIRSKGKKVEKREMSKGKNIERKKRRKGEISEVMMRVVEFVFSLFYCLFGRT